MVAELDGLLPLAVACGGGGEPALLEVRGSFVEACGRAARALLERLEQRALEASSSAPLSSLPALLASCIHLHQRLEHYQHTLREHAHSARARG